MVQDAVRLHPAVGRLEKQRVSGPQRQALHELRPASPDPRPQARGEAARKSDQPNHRRGPGDAGRCGEMWGGVGRCGEVWGGVGRYGERWGGMGRDGGRWPALCSSTAKASVWESAALMTSTATCSYLIHSQLRRHCVFIAQCRPPHHLRVPLRLLLEPGLRGHLGDGSAGTV